MVVDSLSKYGHFMPLKSYFSSTVVVEVFIQAVLKLHGLPHSIVCDWDKAFISHFWKHLFSKMGTSIQMPTAYHPQSNGKMKALNRCLKMYLYCFTGANHKN